RVRADDLRAIDAVIAAWSGHTEEARRLLLELQHATRLGSTSLILAAEAALRIGESGVAAGFFDLPLLHDLAPTIVRMCPTLHPLLDVGRLAPRRSDAVLVWPL